MLDAAELRRASATDAAAVHQYLCTIDSDELNSLLDAFAEAEQTKKDDGAAHEWVALVHLLLRTSSTRQRTVTRILQSLWRGQASEMEALRWVSEISLGYMASVAGAEPGVLSELLIVVQITYQFLRDAVAAESTTATKTLPQLLALVPVLLNLLVEASSSSSAYAGTQYAGDTEGTSSPIIHEHVVELLELPWNVRSVPHLLELLREHSSLVSRKGWAQLRRSVEQLVSPKTAAELPTDCLNPLMRECLLLAAVSADADGDAVGWIRLVRVFLRRLPAHLRQEAEFNVQMALHRSPSLTPLISSALPATTPSGLPCKEDQNAAALDVSDAVLLLHAVRASKPLLHHHLVNSTLVNSVNDTISSRSQSLILRLLRQQTSSTTPESAEHTIRQAINCILEFGGRQPHVRVWKARLLHDFAHSWATAPPSNEMNTGLLVLDTIFYAVSEVREEILDRLLESARLPSKLALAQLRHLVATHTNLLAAHRPLIEDWLSSLAGTLHLSNQLESGFTAVGPLVAAQKDFYNFAMMLVRKQLSSPYTRDRQLAVGIWSSWLENNLALDSQQEEEIVLAIKNAIQVSQNRLQLFLRLLQVVSRAKLRPKSLAELHRFCVVVLREFVELSESGNRGSPRPNIDEHELDGNFNSPPLLPTRFRVQSFDHFFAQDSSITAALQLGPMLESILLCLQRIGVASGVASPSLQYLSAGDSHLGEDVLLWIEVFVRQREEFFRWVSSGEVQLRVEDPHFTWALTARVSIGYALLNLVMRQKLERQPIGGRRLHGLWELIEYQLALTRLWRSFSAATSLKNLTSLQRDHQVDSTLVDTASRCLQPHFPSLLRAIVHVFDRSQGSQDSRCSNTPRASLDGVLFVLDMYVRVLSSSTQVLSADIILDALKSLIAIYSAANPSARTQNVFTTYAEALVSQFPPSMRHLVVPDSPTSLAVTLDAHSRDELRSRICVAILKTLDQHSGRLPLVVLGLSSLVSETSDNCSDVALVDIIMRFLADVQCAMRDEMSSKFRTAGVAVVKRLVELSTSSQRGATDVDIMQRIGEASYELLCDHVVHHLPLLRALLVLSFRVTPLYAVQVDVAVSRIAATLAAAGFQENHAVSSANERSVRKSAEETENDYDEVPLARRRRLRHIHDDNEDQEASDVATGETNVTHELRACTRSFGNTPRQPRLTTPAAQEAALVAAITQLESLHASGVQQILTLGRVSSRQRDDAILPPEDALIQPEDGGEVTMALMTRIYRLLSSTVFTSLDIRWINARTLNKLLVIIKGCTKLGRHCSSAALSKCRDLSLESLLRVFEWSIEVAIRGRAWISLLRDGSKEPTTKTKLSSTVLRLDVFLLDVPSLVASLIKSDTIPSSSKRSLRYFLSTVERDIALSNHVESSSTEAKPPSVKRHLVGVVPIVHSKRRKRLRSRHPFIDSCLAEEDGDDAFADLEDFIA